VTAGSGDAGHVVVVGAGVFGASTASALARRGVDVTLVERITPGHVRSSSGAPSRVLRCGHGDDVWHTRWARDARTRWLALGEEHGVELFVHTGVVWLAHREDGVEAASERTLAAEGVTAERLTPEETARLFPSLVTDDLAFGLLEPDAGALRAALGVRTLVADAEQHGARLVIGTAAPTTDGGVAVSGVRLGADRVVWASGPWLPPLLGDRVGLTVTRQESVHLGVGPEWAAGRVPTWVDYDHAVYGIGDLDGQGWKIAPDTEGPPMDPDTADSRPTDAAVARAREHVAARFPALVDAPVVQTSVCQYTLTADTRFVLAPLDEGGPDGPRTWVAGGGSGHGFKHGPVLGEHVAELVLGVRAPEPMFGLGRRDPAVKLRTAGAD
jgi:sarcosine oxidase